MSENLRVIALTQAVKLMCDCKNLERWHVLPLANELLVWLEGGKTPESVQQEFLDIMKAFDIPENLKTKKE